MAVYNPFDFFLEPAAERFPFAYEAWQRRELQPFLQTEPLDAAACAHTSRRSIAAAAAPSTALVDINRQLQQDIRYVIRLDPGVQDVGADARAGVRLVPRHDVAARAAAAPPRARRALRVRLSDPARCPT